MIVIDSSSLILLAKSSLLEKIVKLDEFIISQGVYEESVIMGKEKGEKDSLMIENLVQKNKIKVKKAEAQKTKELENLLGIVRGENETVALAIQKKCRMVIIDDKKGMVACKILKIPFMISLDVIIDMRENNRISYKEAVQAFEKIKQYGWISEDIMKTREKRLRR